MKNELLPKPVQSNEPLSKVCLSCAMIFGENTQDFNESAVLGPCVMDVMQFSFGLDTEILLFRMARSNWTRKMNYKCLSG